MTKFYQRTFIVRLVNQAMRALIHQNMAPSGMHILSVQKCHVIRFFDWKMLMLDNLPSAHIHEITL